MVSESIKVHLAAILLQLFHAGSPISVRIALDTDVSKLVYPVYRNITALVLLAPLAYFSEKKDRPQLNVGLLIQFFLLGLVGITAKEGFYLLGLDNTSPTFASAMQNTVPAITFLMAVILRFEQVSLTRKEGIAKLLGTVTSVAGASIVTLYRGPTIYTPSLTSHKIEHSLSLSGDTQGKNWILGCIFILGHCFCWSGWIVAQTSVLRKFPARLSLAGYTCFFGTMQFLAIAACVERDSLAWQINSTGEIFSIVYMGWVTSGALAAIQIWVIGKGGPVLVSIYQPLQTLIVAVIASIVFGEDFYLGGVIGAVLIIAGLYLVVWGKTEESKLSTDKDVICSASQKCQGENRDQPSTIEPLLPQICK